MTLPRKFKGTDIPNPVVNMALPVATVFQDYLRELKDYAYENSVADNDPTADGTYYYYLWKKHSFYCNNEVVLHDYSLKSNINV